MAEQVLPGEAFLNKYVLDTKLRKNLEPLLYFNNVLPTTDVDEERFIYEVLENTAAKDLNDGVMTLPMPSGEEAGLTELKMTNISQEKGRTFQIGYAMKLSRDMLRNKARTESELNIRIAKAAWGMAYSINKLTIDSLLASARVSTYSPSVTWGSTTNNQKPLLDLIKGWYEYKSPEYPNRAMNWLMETTNHQELVEYLTVNEIDFNFLNENTIQIGGYPALKNMQFTDVEDQLTHGTSVVADLRGGSIYPGAEMYRLNDPEFAIQRANPDQNTPPDYTGVHVNVTRMDTKPFTTTVEIWTDLVPIVKVEDVIMKQDGL